MGSHGACLRAPRRAAARSARALAVDPWALRERDGLLFGRGVADDKAHLFMLLKATELLAAAGELPVTVRFTIDARRRSAATPSATGPRPDNRAR